MIRLVLSEATEKELLDYFRVTTRLDRAVELIDLVEEPSPDVFVVQSASKPIRYTVDLRGKTCECADWRFKDHVPNSSVYATERNAENVTNSLRNKSQLKGLIRESYSSG